MNWLTGWIGVFGFLASAMYSALSFAEEKNTLSNSLDSKTIIVQGEDAFFAEARQGVYFRAGSAEAVDMLLPETIIYDVVRGKSEGLHFLDFGRRGLHLVMIENNQVTNAKSQERFKILGDCIAYHVIYHYFPKRPAISLEFRGLPLNTYSKAANQSPFGSRFKDTFSSQGFNLNRTLKIPSIRYNSGFITPTQEARELAERKRKLLILSAATGLPLWDKETSMQIIENNRRHLEEMRLLHEEMKAKVDDMGNSSTNLQKSILE